MNNISKHNVVVIGGGYGFSEVYYLISAINKKRHQKDHYKIIGILDDSTALHGQKLNHIDVLGGISLWRNLPEETVFVYAIGGINTKVERKKIIDRHNIPRERFLTLIHPDAEVMIEPSQIGFGCIIHRSVVLQCMSFVGDFCLFSAGTIVGLKNFIGSYSLFASSVTTATGVSFGTCSFIGAGATVAPTAGFTAGMAIDVLRTRYRCLREKYIAVTGASSGLGAMAVAMLNKLGARVTAIVSREADHNFLCGIGVSQIEHRESIVHGHAQNLLPERYDAIIDVAGGELLSRLVKQLKMHGLAVSAGMSSETTLPLNVLPFILRGVTLFGVNAESLDAIGRRKLWRLIAEELLPRNFDKLFKLISLDDLPGVLTNLKHGERHPPGRLVVACL